MKEIKVLMAIRNIDKWNVDWNNQKQSKEILAELSDDIRIAIRNGCGIDLDSVLIFSLEIVK